MSASFSADAGRVELDREITLDVLVWRGVMIEVRYASRHFGGYLAHIELESVEPARAPLPVTETGYRSLFLEAADVQCAGGPCDYALKWLDEAAKEAGWVEYEAASRQMSLF